MLVSFLTMKTRSSKLLGLLTLTLALVAFLTGVVLQPRMAQAQAAGFSDVPASSPYHIQIETLTLLGIIEGAPDGLFHPNAPVTRQQLAKMVILAMRIGVSEADESAFGDVKKTADGTLYPDHYVAAAAREGIVTGYEGPKGPLFRPDASITLAQLVTMGTRATTRSLVVPPDSYRSAWGSFDPKHSVIARVAQYNGLLRELAPPGSTLKSMSPFRTATRAEAAAVLFNIMGTDTAGLNGRFLGDSSDLVRYFREHSGGWQVLCVAGGFGEAVRRLWETLRHPRRHGLGTDDPRNRLRPVRRRRQARAEQHGRHRGNGRRAGQLVRHRGTGRDRAVRPSGLVRLSTHLSDPYCVLVTQPADGPVTTPGDPRHFVQPNGSPHKGNVRTVYELSGKWAVGPDYGAAVQKKAAGIVLSVGLW